MSKAFQVDKLLGFMQEEPEREWMASDFQHSPRFVGYDAGPRLCDLCNMGLVCRVGKQGRFVLFALTEKGRKAWSVDERYKLQTPITKAKSEESSNDQEKPDFLDEEQKSPEDTKQETPDIEEKLDESTPVGDLGEYEVSEKPSIEPYKDGFIVKTDLVCEVDTGRVVFSGSPTDILILALCKKFNVFPKREIFGGSYTIFPVRFSRFGTEI